MDDSVNATENQPPAQETGSVTPAPELFTLEGSVTMPDVQSHAINAALERAGETVEIPLQTPSEPSPPVKRGRGRPRKHPLPPPPAPVEGSRAEQPQPQQTDENGQPISEEAPDCKESAQTAALVFFALVRAVGGEDMNPTPQEVKSTIKSFEGVFIKRGCPDLPPEALLLVTLGGFVASRWNAEGFKKKREGWDLMGKLKWFKSWLGF